SDLRAHAGSHRAGCYVCRPTSAARGSGGVCHGLRHDVGNVQHHPQYLLVARGVKTLGRAAVRILSNPRMGSWHDILETRTTSSASAAAGEVFSAHSARHPLSCCKDTPSLGTTHGQDLPACVGSM